MGYKAPLGDLVITSTEIKQTSFLRKNLLKIIAIIFWLLLIGGYIWYTASQQVSPLETLTQLVLFMKENVWGPAIFILIYTLRPIVFFSALALSIAGGFLFGPLLGVFFTVVGSNAGASLAYVIGRFLSSSNIENQGRGIAQRYAKRLRANSFETILIMRFIFLPYDLVNYLAGFLKVKYPAFLLATVLGSIPGTLAFVLIGASFEDFDLSGGFPKPKPWVLIASVVIFIASIGLSQLFKRRETKKGAEDE